MTALISPTTSLESRQCVASTRSRGIGTVQALLGIDHRSEVETVVRASKIRIRGSRHRSANCNSGLQRFVRLHQSPVFSKHPASSVELRDLELSLIPADGTTWTQAGRTHPEESRLGLPGISPNGFKAHPPLAVAIARLVKRQPVTDFHESIATQLHLADQHETERMLSRTVPH